MECAPYVYQQFNRKGGANIMRTYALQKEEMKFYGKNMLVQMVQLSFALHAVEVAEATAILNCLSLLQGQPFWRCLEMFLCHVSCLLMIILDAQLNLEVGFAENLLHVC
jgi:hypothetical protein